MASTRRSTIRPPRRKRTAEPDAEHLRKMIAELWDIMARVKAASDQEQGFELLVTFMEKYSLVSTRMAALLKAQRDLSGDAGAGAALSEALQMALDSFPGWNSGEAGPR